MEIIGPPGIYYRPTVVLFVSAWPNYWLSPRLSIDTCVPSLSATVDVVRSVRHHHGLWESLLCRIDPWPFQLIKPTLQWEVIRARLSAYAGPSLSVIRIRTGVCTTHSLAMQRLLLFSSLIALGYTQHTSMHSTILFWNCIVCTFSGFFFLKLFLLTLLNSDVWRVTDV